MLKLVTSLFLMVPWNVKSLEGPRMFHHPFLRQNSKPKNICPARPHFLRLHAPSASRQWARGQVGAMMASPRPEGYDWVRRHLDQLGLPHTHMQCNAMSCHVMYACMCNKDAYYMYIYIYTPTWVSFYMWHLLQRLAYLTVIICIWSKKETSKHGLLRDCVKLFSPNGKQVRIQQIPNIQDHIHLETKTHTHARAQKLCKYIYIYIHTPIQ